MRVWEWQVHCMHEVREKGKSLSKEDLARRVHDLLTDCIDVTNALRALDDEDARYAASYMESATDKIDSAMEELGGCDCD